MSKFKVGDKVRVYDCARGLKKMFVIGYFPDGTLQLAWSLDSNEGISAWPQQCRKLVKKPRREIWVGEFKDERSGPYIASSMVFATKELCENNGSLRVGFLRAVKFREVKE